MLRLRYTLCNTLEPNIMQTKYVTIIRRIYCQISHESCTECALKPLFNVNSTRSCVHCGIVYRVDLEMYR